MRKEASIYFWWFAKFHERHDRDNAGLLKTGLDKVGDKQ